MTTPERHAPTPTTLLVTHHCAYEVCITLAQQGGMLQPIFQAMAHYAYTSAQLMAMRETQAIRALDPQHIAREASRASAAAWQVYHLFGRTTACRYCGLTALECQKRNIPLECPERKQHVPDWL